MWARTREPARFVQCAQASTTLWAWGGTRDPIVYGRADCGVAAICHVPWPVHDGVGTVL